MGAGVSMYDVSGRAHLVDLGLSPTNFRPAAVQLAPVDGATLAPLQHAGFALSPVCAECPDPAASSAR